MPDPKVDAFFARQSLWRDEMAALRPELLGAGLDETLKWGKPCYAVAGANVAILQPFKPCLGLMFFKGALLADPDHVLHRQGENSQAARRMEFRSPAEVAAQLPALRTCLAGAIALERAGARVDFAAGRELVLPEELVERLDSEPELAAAWAALTPGRQRSWALHISGAKKTETRAARVAKAEVEILAGKGLGGR